MTNSDICIHKEGLARVNHAHENDSLTGSICFLPEVKQSRQFSYSSAFEIDEKEINSILTVHSPRSN